MKRILAALGLLLCVSTARAADTHFYDFVNGSGAAGALTGTWLIPITKGGSATFSTTPNSLLSFLQGQSWTFATGTVNFTGTTQFGGVGFTLPVTAANGGTGRTTLTANSIMIGNGTGTVSLLAESDGNCAVGAAGVWTTGSCGSSSGSLTVADTLGHSVSSTTTLTAEAGFVVGGSAGSATLTPYVVNSTHTTSVSVANIGGQDNYNGSSLTATVPGMGTIGNGQSIMVINQAASALTLSESQTVNGCPVSSLAQGGFLFGTGNGSSFDGGCFPGFAAFSGDISGTAAGALTVNKIGGTAITLGTLTDGKVCSYTASGTVLSCTLTASGTGTVTSIATTSPLGGGTITTTGTLTCTTCVVASSPGAGIAHFAGSTQTVTSSAIVAADITSATITGTQIASSIALAGSPTTTTQSAKDNSTKIATTAYVDAPTGLTAGTSVSLAAPRQYFVCTGTCTVTPPTPAAGYEFCVMNDDNVATVITMAAIASVSYESTARTSYGTANHTFTSGGAAADKVCILGRDSTHYLTVSFNGTWTLN